MVNEKVAGKILVVDDEIELKNALVDALVKESYEARGCTSAQQALDALREEDFDLLISDLMMPGMDGIELMKVAKEIDPSLITVIMTGQGTMQTEADARKAGTFDYLLKPFRVQTLMSIVTRAIAARRHIDGPVQTDEVGPTAQTASK
jgi:two-component system response regulator AtoC